MPYVQCPRCFVRIYSAAVHAQRDDCPRCFTPLEIVDERSSAGQAQPRYAPGTPEPANAGDLAGV